MITIIVACDRHNLIGDSQSPSGMPWHHAEDFAHFKKTTLNHTILMGRKTYEAIGRPLPKRQTLVLSSQPLDLPEGARWVSSLEEVLQAYRQSGEDLYICGGASIYKQCYPWRIRSCYRVFQGIIKGMPGWLISVLISSWITVNLKKHLH